MRMPYQLLCLLTLLINLRVYIDVRIILRHIYWCRSYVVAAGVATPTPGIAVAPTMRANPKPSESNKSGFQQCDAFVDLLIAHQLGRQYVVD